MILRPLELSRLLNLAPSAVSMAIKRGQLIKTRDGIDTADPTNIAWLREHLPDAGALREVLGKSKKKNKIDFEAVTGLPERVANMTLRDFVLSGEAMKHGKAGSFFVRLFGKLQGAQKSLIECEEKRRHLISRDLVEEHIMAYLDDLDSALDRLPAEVFPEIVQAVLREEKTARLTVPEKLRGHMTRIIRETKAAASERLKKLKNNDEY